MTKRKLILLIVTGVLFVIALLQSILGNLSPVKTIKLDTEPDKITVTSSSNSYELTKKNGTWYVGTDNFEAKKTEVNQMIKAVQEIKVLEKVGSASNEMLEERFDLLDSKAIVVTASKQDKELRTLKIGKSTSTGSQSYATLDSKKDVYLISGNLSNIFNKTSDSLRSEYIYEVSSKDITSISVSKNANTWTLERTNKPNQDSEWKGSGTAENLVLDNAKVDAWVNQIATLKVSKWLEDDVNVPSNKEVQVQFTINGQVTDIAIYKEGIGDNAKYICVCNRTPHKAELSKITATKFIKDANELKKTE